MLLYFFVFHQGGMYVLYMYDIIIVAGGCMFIVAFTECITIGWLFGADRFWEHVCQMLNFRPPGRRLFTLVFKFVAPLSMAVKVE